MSVKISSSTINKLEHDIDEIRIRTLKHIEAKLSRALLQNENIIFNSGILLKQLIRWFGRRPLSEEETVLNLILMILRSNYSDETIKYLGIDRLKCEIGKIYEILINNNNDKENFRKLLAEIKEILENYKISLNINKSNNNNINEECSEIHKITNSRKNSLNDDGIIEISDSTDFIKDEFSSDYEKLWSIPNISDFNSLKQLHESLSSIEENDLNHTFKYLRISILDHPAEYFLQPPYIFKALLKMYVIKKENSIEYLLQNFIYLTKSLLGRIKMKKLSKTYYIPSTEEEKLLKLKTQITVTRFCIELFNLCLETLKEFTETDNNQEYVFLTFQLLYELINLIDEDPNCYITFQSLLIDLGYITKYYRQYFQHENVTNRLYRMYYIIYLDLISKIIVLSNKKNNECNQNSNQYTNNNLYNLKKSSPINLKACSKSINVEIWYEELQYALLDFSLKGLYPNVYEKIEYILKSKNVFSKTSQEFETILNCDKLFLPAIQILRQPDLYNDKEFILQGYEAMKTLSIHQSSDFVQRLFATIIRCVSFFDGNIELKTKSENIMLRLFAHENLSIKKFIYNESANKMKIFFAELMDGKQNLGKICGSTIRKAKTLGIPLTVDILNEIICFGYTHKNICINKNAEIIISLILKGKHLLGEYWLNILDILLPNIPLLQCLTTKESTLGSLVLDFLNPDNDIPFVEILRGNLCYLFNPDPIIRSEALSRLIYILSIDKDSNIYMPNILEICDTLSNDLCILKLPKDPEKIFSNSYYEKSSVFTILELLCNKDVDPSIRKTSLMQLNVMCQDPELNDLIHDENGWYLAIQAIENSLKKDPIIDYPDTLIPAIGIISKISLYNQQFRHEISKEKNIYLLLIRSLFLFHYDTILKQDCTLMIFLLVFNSFIIGNKTITIPKHLSELILPIKCEFHWYQTQYNEKNDLEKIFTQLTCDHNDENDENSSRKSILSQIITEKKCDDIQKLQYIRLNFTKIWFGGFEFILKSIKSNKMSLNDNNVNLNYSILPGHLHKEINENVVELLDTMKFNNVLKLTAADIKILKYTLQTENMRYFFKKIWKTNKHSEILMNLINIQLCTILPSPTISKFSNFKIIDLIDCLRKFMVISNINSEKNLLLYGNIIKFFIYFLHNENKNYSENQKIDKNLIILKWLLEDLQQEKYSVPLMIIKNLSYPRLLYQNVCKLLEVIVKISFSNFNENDIKCLIMYKENSLSSTSTEKSLKIEQNLYNKLFEFLIPILDECFNKRFLTRFCKLLNLIKTLTETRLIDIDSGYSCEIIKKMLYIMMTLKSFTHVGSNYIKSCLLIIGNLIENIKEFVLENNHIRFLSGLCSHINFEVRGLSWCILAKMAKNLIGAQNIVKELSYLPGGFHACCLSTILDKTEIPLVRATVGNCFSNLLLHKIKSKRNANTNEKEDGLDLTVAPFCIEIDPSDENMMNGLQLIKEIFKKYRFYTAISKSLKYFYISDEIVNHRVNEITTCEIVISYCSILINYIDINPDNVIDEIIEKSFLIEIFNLIKQIPLCKTKTTLEMSSCICDLLIRIIKSKSSINLQKNIVRDREFIIALIELLSNIESFEIHNDYSSVSSILEILRIFSNEKISFEIICDIFHNNEKNAKNLISLLNFGVLLEDLEFQNSCLKFITSLLIKSQTEVYKFTTFSTILDTIIISDLNLGIQNNSHNYGSEILFDNLKKIFKKAFSCQNKSNRKSQLVNKKLIAHTVGVLLKTTKKSRNLAKKLKFLEMVIQQLSKIFNDMGMQCTDFIRKYGDNKKSLIISELTILYEIILNWYSSDCLINDEQIYELCKIIIQTWPWVTHSNELKEIFFKCLAFLSEDSVLVCKQFSSTISNFTNSILQLLANYVITETKKTKHPSIDFTSLKIGLRIITNCCSCIEGRIQIVKINLLDIFDLFHPSTTKLQKSWNTITLIWLKFWSIFSRHPEGAAIRHLILLCNLVIRGNELIRYECLTVLRNMSFISSNRAALLSSQNFLYIVTYILTKGTTNEKLLIIITLWKLITDNYRAKHTIKNTKIPYQLKMISEYKSNNSSSHSNCNINKLNPEENYNDDESDLVNVIDILLKLLN